MIVYQHTVSTTHTNFHLFSVTPPHTFTSYALRKRHATCSSGTSGKSLLLKRMYSLHHMPLPPTPAHFPSIRRTECRPLVLYYFSRASRGSRLADFRSDRHPVCNPYPTRRTHACLPPMCGVLVPANVLFLTFCVTSLSVVMEDSRSVVGAGPDGRWYRLDGSHLHSPRSFSTAVSGL